MAVCVPTPPGLFCLFYKRGDDFPSQFKIVEDDGTTAINITGWAFTLTVDPNKNPATDASNLFSVGGILDDALNGLVSFAPTASNTDIAVKKYWYDIQQIDGAGKKRTIVKDRFIIEMDITKT